MTLVARALSWVDGTPVAAPSGSPRTEQSAPNRERGRRLALVRAATDPVRPKSSSVRRLRIGHARPQEALVDAIDAALDATPPYAMAHAEAGWLALLADLKAHFVARTRAGRAEAEYARLDDE
jgi:hypothetical protein